MRLERLLIVGAALVACTGATAQRWVVEPDAPGVVARGDGLLRRAMLAAHDAVRRDAGVAALGWDPSLAAAAREYARELARSDSFRHSSGPRGHAALRQGENLWTGTRGAYDYREMAAAWAAERGDFSPGVVPYVSRTGRFEDVGHYVQMIWPMTSRFGCATASSRARDYLVCRYAPPGNVVGRWIGFRSPR